MLYTDASTQWSFFTYGLSNTAITDPATTVINTYYHFVCTWNASTGVKRLYKDSILVAEALSVTGTTTPSTNAMKLGMYAGSGADLI